MPDSAELLEQMRQKLEFFEQANRAAEARAAGHDAMGTELRAVEGRRPVTRPLRHRRREPAQAGLVTETVPDSSLHVLPSTRLVDTPAGRAGPAVPGWAPTAPTLVPRERWSD